MKKILLFSLVGLVLVGASVAGTLFFTGALGKEHATATHKAVVAKEPQPNHSEAIYFQFEPDFTVNVQDKSRPRFLQIVLVAVAYTQEAVDALQLHMPVIRDGLLLLFGEQDAEALKTREAKESLRSKALGIIQTRLKERYGDKGVEDVYFTKIIIQ